ncbi:MAG: hypothetical protein NTX88_06945, partial [Candidatus Atribacteria bacterium]|nr:hypothetical protein [Candidatus Atribacteria bacterium]
MDEIIQWFLSSSPWVEYRTRLDLLDQPENHPQVQKVRQAMISHPQIQSLLHDLSKGFDVLLNNHKSAGHPIHQLSFVADLGIHADDGNVEYIVNHILEHQSLQGPFQVLMNISPHYGGTGENQWAWALCDAPVVLYSLFKLGLGQDNRVQKGIHYLASVVRDNGWWCMVSPELGKFRGPGRKDDPCPYATLVMLKLLSLTEEYRQSETCRIGAEVLLRLWERSQDLHPYLFYMGTDFRKLKVPLVWYDIVHVLEVLSSFPWLRGDSRLQNMFEVARSKKDSEGKY